MGIYSILTHILYFAAQCMLMYDWASLHRKLEIIHLECKEGFSGGILQAVITAYESWYCYVYVNARS